MTDVETSIGCFARSRAGFALTETVLLDALDPEDPGNQFREIGAFRHKKRLKDISLHWEKSECGTG